MGLDATTGHGRCNLGRAPPRDGRAPRSLREDARRASLVGLVRALSERASERQQSRGGSSRRRSIHGGGPSRSSPMMPFEWPHYPSIPNTQTFAYFMALNIPVLLIIFFCLNFHSGVGPRDEIFST
ncbi:MAG: hypothetical protein WAM42_12150 [Candidatus Nitrosopolaris sp.]